MIRICLCLLLCSLSLTGRTQVFPFEQSSLLFVSGDAAIETFSYNPLTDIITVKGEYADELIHYTPAQIKSFSYDGYDYYSLPLNGGYSFFRVLHEGDDFAVLYKLSNVQLLEYVVQQSRGGIRVCVDESDPSKFLICEGPIGPSFGMPTYTGSGVEYQVENAVFLAVGDELHLLNCKYDTKGQNFSSMPSLRRKNQITMKRIKDVVRNEQKMLALRKHVASASINLEDPEQLVLALKTIYN